MFMKSFLQVVSQKTFPYAHMLWASSTEFYLDDFQRFTSTLITRSVHEIFTFTNGESSNFFIFKIYNYFALLIIFIVIYKIFHVQL